MKKRGISPLIATVLLIGFTIVIAALVMIWGSNLVKERAEKIGAKSEAQISCAAKIEIDLKQAECSNSKIKVAVENKGTDSIDGFRARIHYGSDVETKTIPLQPVLKGTSQRTIEIEYDDAKNPTSVEIIPFVTKQSLSYTCSEQLKQIDTENC